jgi:hypothetical protein
LPTNETKKRKGFLRAEGTLKKQNNTFFPVVLGRPEPLDKWNPPLLLLSEGEARRMPGEDRRYYVLEKTPGSRNGRSKLWKRTYVLNDDFVRCLKNLVVHNTIVTG